MEQEQQQLTLPLEVVAKCRELRTLADDVKTSVADIKDVLLTQFVTEPKK